MDVHRTGGRPRPQFPGHTALQRPRVRTDHRRPPSSLARQRVGTVARIDDLAARVAQSQPRGAVLSTFEDSVHDILQMQRSPRRVRRAAHRSTVSARRTKRVVGVSTRVNDHPTFHHARWPPPRHVARLPACSVRSSPGPNRPIHRSCPCSQRVDPSSVTRPRPRRVASWRSVAGAVVVVALCAIHLKWPDGGFGQVTYLTVTVGASVVAWLSVRRFGGSSRVWLAVGISASALGDGIYEVYVRRQGRRSGRVDRRRRLDRVVRRGRRRHAPDAARRTPPHPSRPRRSDRHGGHRPDRSAHPLAVLDRTQHER